jgi:hypothetical protein
MTLWGLAGSLTAEIVTNWETIKTRLVAIFDEIKQAAPSWLGGGDKGWAGFSKPGRYRQAARGLAELSQVLA